MSIERETFEELCASFALGALEPEEVRQLEQALASAEPDALAFYQTMQEVALVLPLSLDREAPPLYIRQQLLAEVRRRKGIAVNQSSAPSMASAAVAWWQKLSLVWSMTAALFVAGVGLSYTSWNFNQKMAMKDQKLQQLTERDRSLRKSVNSLKRENQQQKQTLQKQRKAIVAMKNSLKRKERLLALLAKRNVELVRMEVKRSRKLKSYAGGYAKVIWDTRSNQAMLQLSGLPKYKDKVYQLWMMERGGKILQKAGFYKYEGKRYNYYKAPVPRPKQKRRRKRVQFAISVEPKGGSPKPGPTGDIVMVSGRISL